MDVSGGSDNPLSGNRHGLDRRGGGRLDGRQRPRKRSPGRPVSPAGGAFTPPFNLAIRSPSLFASASCGGRSGDAVAVWTRSNGTHSIVQGNAFDAAVPQLSGVSIPSGACGRPVAFAANSSDFGRSAHRPSPSARRGATGNAVAHAYRRRAPTGDDHRDKRRRNGRDLTGSISIRTRGDFKVGKLKKRKRKGPESSR